MTQQLDPAHLARAEEQRALDAAFARRDQLIEGLDLELSAPHSPGGTHAGAGVAANVVEDSRLRALKERQVELTHAEQGLIFGRLVYEGGGSRVIGRTGLSDPFDPDQPLVMDWRAPAARPFYTATALNPEGYTSRRHIRTRAREVIGVDDEPLGVSAESGLVGEGALLAALDERRTGHMSSAAATLQHEQDRVVRADPRGALVVQGGPGTGKTVVALHRVAYLLFSHPQITAGGVLLLGPSARFLDYISQVLPALGETAVVAATCETLLPDTRACREESRTTARAKGRAEWQGSLEAYVDALVPKPARLQLVWDGDEYVVPRATVERLLTSARSGRSYLAARRTFLTDVADVLVELVADRAVQMLHDVEDGFEALLARVDASLSRHDDRLLDTGAAGSMIDGTPTDEEIEELRNRIHQDPAFTAQVQSWWPTLEAQTELRRILTEPQILRKVTPFLTPAERRQILSEGLEEPEGPEWAPGDIALLDALSDLIEDTSPPRPDVGFVAERAASQRGWVYGHVVIDEAQELSPMQWHMVARRCTGLSLTAVGDIDQGESPHPHTSWEEALNPALGSRWRHEQLSICYRTPVEVMTLTRSVLEAAGSSNQPPRAVRSSGITPWTVVSSESDLASVVTELTVALRERWAEGTVGVIAPHHRVAELANVLATTSPSTTVLTPSQAKGLEWDATLVVDRDQIINAPRGHNQLYVALTRCTQELGQVTVT